MKNLDSLANTCGKIFFHFTSIIILVSCIWFSLIWIVQNSHYILLYHTALSSGWLSGSLHAITGSDHLASLLPIILAQRWRSGLLYGAIWGFGHGLTSFIVGSTACGMKNFVFGSAASNATVFLRKYRYLSDIVTATTILVIGIMGIYESSSEDNEGSETTIQDRLVAKASSSCDNLSAKSNTTIELEDGYSSLSPGDSIKSRNPSDKSNSENTISIGTDRDMAVDVVTQSSSRKRNISSKYTATFYDSVKLMSVCIHGAALGLSLDGLPSLTPAIILEQRQTLVFLGMYWLSTTVIMSLAACIVAEASYYFTSKQQSHSSRRMSSSTKSSSNLAADVESNSTEKGQPNTLLSDIDYEKMHYENRLARVASLAACLIGSGYLILSLMRLCLQYFYADGVHNLEGTWVQLWMIALAVPFNHQEHSFLPVMNDGTGSDVSRASNDDNRFVASLLTTPPHEIPPVPMQEDSASAIDISLTVISTVSILVALLYGLGGGKLFFGERSIRLGTTRSQRYHQ